MDDNTQVTATVITDIDRMQEEENDIPIEEQVEVVDETNMDPLEWTVRKTISIPKKYYWDTGNYDVSIKTKLWHRSIYALGCGLHTAESIGGFFTNVLGLNASRYDYVTDFMTAEEWEEAKKHADESKLQRKKLEETKVKENAV